MRETGLEALVIRRVSYTWRRHPMTLALSQSLFSSAGVDRGTHLLLQSLAALRSRLPARPVTLDLGCGCGVLGIALALDGATVRLRDRDALAVAFSARNCAENGVREAVLEGELDLQGLDERVFDLVVSNLPAKAGVGVHAAMLRGIRRHLAHDGLAAVVVITALEPRIAEAASAAGLRIETVERRAAHVVLHLRPGATPSPPAGPDPLGPYHRGSGRFRVAGTGYALETFQGLPEFDTPAHATRLALETMARTPGLLGTNVATLVWNPGQGHVPAWLAARDLGPVTVGGRDLLALRASERNARCTGRVAHTWHPEDAGSGYGLVVLFPDDDPSAGWEGLLPGIAVRILGPGGHLVLSAPSTFVGRFLKSAVGLSLLRSVRRAGTRCVILRREGGPTMPLFRA